MNEYEEAKLVRALKDAEDAIRDARAKGYDYTHDNASGYSHCLIEAIRRLGSSSDHYPVPRRAVAQAAGLLLAALIQHPDQSDGTAGSRNPEVDVRCGECRLGLGTHRPEDPLCSQHGERSRA